MILSIWNFGWNLILGLIVYLGEFLIYLSQDFDIFIMLIKYKMRSYVSNIVGAYDEEESAARAYDLAALKYWGTSTFTNFQVSDYEKEIEIMNTMTKEEYLATLRR